MAVSILLIKNPAGANEVLRTLRLEAEGEAAAGCRPLDRAQRPDRRRARRLLDLGRRLRAARGQCDGGSGCAGTRAAEMALRLKYAGVDPSVDRASSPRSQPRSTAPSQASGERLFALPTYTALIELRTLLDARAGWPRSTGDERRDDCGRGDLARRRVRVLRRRPCALGRELAAEAAGPGARARRRHRPGGAASSPARGHEVTALDASPALIEELARVRPPKRLGGRDDRRRRAHARRSSAAAAAILAPMQLVHLLGGRVWARESAGRGGGAPRARRRVRGGRSRRRSDRRRRPGSPAPRRPRARRLGLLEPAGRDRASRGRRSRSGACASWSPRAASSTRSSTWSDSTALTAERLEHEAIAVGLAAARADRGPADRRPRRLDRLRDARPADGAAPADALPRADEHLRRPRQHPLPAPALRVARDRVRALDRRPRRGLRSGSPRPDLHRRRPGPRPAAGRRGHAADQARGSRALRSPTAPWCSPSAAAISSSATATSSATSGSRASASSTSRRFASPARG